MLLVVSQKPEAAHPKVFKLLTYLMAKQQKSCALSFDQFDTFIWLLNFIICDNNVYLQWEFDIQEVSFYPGLDIAFAQIKTLFYQFCTCFYLFRHTALNTEQWKLKLF